MQLKKEGIQKILAKNQRYYEIKYNVKCVENHIHFYVTYGDTKKLNAAKMNN